MGVVETELELLGVAGTDGSVLVTGWNDGASAGPSGYIVPQSYVVEFE
jgi:hypothetical protein